eukprot:3616616-Pyramimonas_sp.AAC.1
MNNRLSAYADIVADPLLDYIRRLPEGARIRVSKYLRARCKTIESRNLPGSDNALVPMCPHLRPKLYAIACGLGRGEAF